MSDSNGILPRGFEVDVVPDVPRTFTCNVAGTRPAATIQWFLDDVVQSIGLSNATRDGLDGLAHTTSTWTLTPSVANHRKEVKCLARTPESEEPFPSTMITLNFAGGFINLAVFIIIIIIIIFFLKKDSFLFPFNQAN